MAAPREDGGYLEGGQIARRILELYLETFETLDTLGEGDFVRSAEGLLRGDTDQSAELLADLSARAIEHLSADLSRQMGRGPARMSDWRVIRYGLTSARTLRQAIMHCIDCFEAFDGRWGWISLRHRGAVAELQFDARRPARSWAGCLIDLSGMSQIHALLAWLIARPLPLRGLFLDHDFIAVNRLDLPRLSIPLAVDQEWTGFSFASVYLDYPCIRTAQEFELKPPSGFLFDAPTRSEAETVAHHVRRLALRSLLDSTRLPRFDELVGKVGVSSATLRRQLAMEGTSYREIKDSCRREVGLDILRRSDLSIEEIAARLDFCDSDAFRRAFRQWLGISPSRYRREAAHDFSIHQSE